ncbi:MAG TPA: 50S ribosomal protein L15 [Xanthobacteraceae bacterium]|nr:50S ribosomal protein L15 [Xanthobacteraceae bacterium]
MKLNEIADNEGARKNRIRVGRGIGSGKGKTGGRGVKGQKSRTGVRIKGREGGQMPLHRRLPKRGFNNIFAIEYSEVNLDRIQQAVDAKLIKAGDTVTADSLVKAGVVRRAGNGVRLLGKGELKTKLSFEVAGASKSAIEAVEKLGGSVKQLVVKKADREKPGKMQKKPKKEAAK